MKAVHLVISDLYGAGRAAWRICCAERSVGIDAELYVLNRDLNTPSKPISLSKKEKLFRQYYKHSNDRKLKPYQVSTYYHADHAGLDFAKRDFVRDADVVHFHWVNEGLYSDQFMKSLASTGKPVVWTLHDMWAFTGGCHYTGDCRRFTDGCGCCPGLSSSEENDLSRREVSSKSEILRNMNTAFAGCSKWITDEANSSTVLKTSGKNCVNIPNPINSDSFRKLDKTICRQLLNIQSDKKLILMGAVNPYDLRKGYQYLKEALLKLDPEKYILCMFGQKKDSDLSSFESIHFGSIYDDLHLAMIYSACDVFAAPSVQENLANTVMESLACGTPVTAFRIGGMPDMINHRENGFLAEPFSCEELASGIEYCAFAELPSDKIAEETAERFSFTAAGTAYQKLYSSLIRK